MKKIKRKKILEMPKKQEILEMFEVHDELLKEALEKENVIYLTEEEFDKTYPDSFEIVDGKFTKLPYKLFIVKNKNNVYTAIDNTEGDAWCEDFYMLEQAYIWLKNDQPSPKYKVIIIPSPQRIGRRWEKWKAKKK